MKNLTKHLIFLTGIIFCALLFISCTEPKTDDTVTTEKEIPLLEAADQEYADIVLKVYDQLSAFDFDAFSGHLTDDIMWYWPDGNSETRTTIKGKDNLITWWKNWKESTGVEEMTFTKKTLLPLKVNKPSNYYKLVGSGVLAYTDLTVTLQGKSTSVRQHTVFMFNEDKKISHALFYYDRTGLIELTKVILSETE